MHNKKAMKRRKAQRRSRPFGPGVPVCPYCGRPASEWRAETYEYRYPYRRVRIPGWTATLSVYYCDWCRRKHLRDN